MERGLTPATINTMMRGVVVSRRPDHTEDRCYRTALHVDFAADSQLQEAERLHEGPGYTGDPDPEEFNAIGSLARGPATILRELHLPVIDVASGAETQAVKSGSKAILHASHNGAYTPGSLLRDVLGDHGIELEVFPYVGSRIMFEGNVASIVLRTEKDDVFETIDSSGPGEDRGHLLIQRAFEAADHLTLIQELGKVGVINESWQQLVERIGMGVVRTPWTDEDRAAVPV